MKTLNATFGAPSLALRRFRPLGRRGFTMLEIMIASTIMILVLGMISAGYLKMLQVERSNDRVMTYASEALQLKRLLRQHASAARQIVSPDGRSARIIARNGVTAEVRYEDGDGDWRTIGDNRIVFFADISVGDLDDPATPRDLVIRFVSPTGNGANPIFNKLTANAFSPLEVEFTIGDYAFDPAAPCHRITGPGYQSYFFRARTSPRNTP
jgi:type II secretory pathway pseudopilin PulG